MGCGKADFVVVIVEHKGGFIAFQLLALLLLLFNECCVVWIKHSR